MSSHPQTIPAALDHIAGELPNHDALVTEDRTLTFDELRNEVRRAAAAMISLGVSPGDRVAIWSPNTWHWVVACLATHYAGAIVVPLNTRYTAAEPPTSWPAPALPCWWRWASFSAPTGSVISISRRCPTSGTSSECRSRATTARGTSS